MHSILYVCMYIFICSEQQSRSIYIFFNSANMFRFWVCTLGSRKEMSVTLAFLCNLHMDQALERFVRHTTIP